MREAEQTQHLGYQAKAKFQQCENALGQLHGCFSAKAFWYLFYKMIYVMRVNLHAHKLTTCSFFIYRLFLINKCHKSHPKI